jgi:hypothetical protein
MTEPVIPEHSSILDIPKHRVKDCDDTTRCPHSATILRTCDDGRFEERRLNYWKNFINTSIRKKREMIPEQASCARAFRRFSRSR